MREKIKPRISFEDNSCPPNISETPEERRIYFFISARGKGYPGKERKIAGMGEKRRKRKGKRNL